MGATIRRPKMGISPNKFGKARANGLNIESAMLAAGYAPATAKKGRAKLSRECLIAEQKFVAEKAEELRRFGASMTPEQQADLVRGRLAVNTVLGEDGGTQSAKALGSDKRVAMWQPEGATGIVIIQAPRELPVLPILDGQLESPADQALLENKVLEGTEVCSG